MTYTELIKLSYQNPIIAYDGECILCDGSIQWLISQDTHEVFRYTHLQHIDGSDSEAIKMDSVLLFDQGDILYKSDVSIRVSSSLAAPYSWLRYSAWIPKMIRDRIYEIIAANRYKWFGKKDHCMIPNQAQKNLFI